MIIEKIIKEDPSENLQTPKKWERLPKALSLEDVISLLDSRTDNFTFLRDTAMLRFFILRASVSANLFLLSLIM